MAIVTKIIRGRAYHYQQTSKRVGGKVKTTSIYIGPVNPKRQRNGVLSCIGEFITANFQHEHIVITEAELQKELVRTKEREARRDRALDELHAKYGMRLGPVTPIPIDKASLRSAPTNLPQTDEVITADADAATDREANAEVDT